MNLFDDLPPSIICNIIEYIDYTIDLLNFAKISEKMKRTISPMLMLIESEKVVNIELRSLKECVSLYVLSDNIIVNVDNVEDLDIVKNMKALRKMNINVGALDNELCVIPYLDAFLDKINKDKFYIKTFRILFNIAIRNKRIHLAIVIDNSYISVENIRHLRYVVKESNRAAYMHFQDKVESTFRKHFPKAVYYYITYNDKEVKFYKSTMLTDIKLNDNNLTFDIRYKGDFIFIEKKISINDRYLPDSFCKLLIMDSGLNSNKYRIVNLDSIVTLLYLYCSKHNYIAKGGKSSKSKINIWKFAKFSEYYNITQEYFVSLTESKSLNVEDVENAIAFSKNVVDINLIVEFILYNCHPLDIIIQKDLNHVYLY